MTPLRFDLDELVTEFIENTYHTDFGKYDCGCKYCENGIIENTDFVGFWGAIVPMQSSEVCDCVWDSQKLRIKVYVKWLKSQFLDNELILSSIFM